MHAYLRSPYFAAITWLLFVSVLFFLPGSAFPGSGWLGKFQIDKWVHVGIFSLLCFFWGKALNLSTPKGFFLLGFFSLLYGLLVEVVQDRLIPNRSFDIYDLAADAVGIALGLWFWVYIKK